MRSAISKALPTPTMTSQLVTKNQSAEDIARLLVYAEKQSRAYVPKILKYFDAKTDREACNRVWYFLRNNINYRKEPPARQTAKTINRLIADGYGDCKHYATFSVAVLRALGIPCCFRLASFTYGNPSPTHAYCVAFVNGKEIYLDACIKNFDNECAYKHKTDIKPAK